jgi:prepilin-type N-terminal cleavage/methylation domain-containing protein
MTRLAAPRKGVTLIEILLVMAILITLATVAWPSMTAVWGDFRVKAAADQVREAWTEARAFSIEEGRSYRFSVQPDTGKYRIAPDSDSFWGGSGPGDDENAAPANDKEDELPDKITFQVPSGIGEMSSSGWVTVAIFKPDGTCAEDREITLAGDDDVTPVIIQVRAMTGAITVKKQTSSGKQ